MVYIQIYLVMKSSFLENHGTPEVLNFRTLKCWQFKQRSSHKELCPKRADGMANSVDPDQTAPREDQSDLVLHCLPKPVCPKTLDSYGISRQSSSRQQMMSNKMHFSQVYTKQ